MRALKTARGVCRSRARCGLRLVSSKEEGREKVGRNRVLVRVLPRVCAARPGSSLQSKPAVAAGSMKQGTRCDPCLRRSSGTRAHHRSWWALRGRRVMNYLPDAVDHGAEIYAQTSAHWLERQHEG